MGNFQISDLLFAIFVHARFGEPDGTKFEDAIAKLRKRPEQAFRAQPVVCFAKMRTFVKGAMNNIRPHKPSAEPDRDLVECAIAEVLEIAQRQGITAADFIRMLDSGMRRSDFLNATNVFAKGGHTFDRDFS